MHYGPQAFSADKMTPTVETKWAILDNWSIGFDYYLMIMLGNSSEPDRVDEFRELGRWLHIQRSTLPFYNRPERNVVLLRCEDHQHGLLQWWNNAFNVLRRTVYQYFLICRQMFGRNKVSQRRLSSSFPLFRVHLSLGIGRGSVRYVRSTQKLGIWSFIFRIFFCAWSNANEYPKTLNLLNNPSTFFSNTVALECPSIEVRWRFHSDANCGGLLTASSDWQFLSSPGFPDPGYSQDQQCAWMVQVSFTRILSNESPGNFN